MKCFVLYAPLVASFSYKDWKNKKERPKQVEAISVNKFLPAPSIDHSLHSNHMFCLSVTQFSTPASLASSHYFALLHIFQSSSLYLFCFPWPSILQMARGPGAQFVDPEMHLSYFLHLSFWSWLLSFLFLPIKRIFGGSSKFTLHNPLSGSMIAGYSSTLPAVFGVRFGTPVIILAIFSRPFYLLYLLFKPLHTFSG